MRRPPHPRRALVTTALCATAFLSHAAAAQPGPATPAGDSLAAMIGSIRGADGVGIANAEVTLAPHLANGTSTIAARRLYSDSAGTFRFPPLPRGDATLTVRRIGFKPVSLETKLPGDGPLAVRLESNALTLSAMVVQDRRNRYEGWLAQFNRRRDAGIGRFITRGQIDARNPTHTTDLLRMMPGVAVGGGGIRGSSLRLRGSRCDPLIWVDGSPALAGYLDIDAFTPNSLDGIEVYNGVSEVPVELRGPRGEERCGVIALWSRMPERRTKQPKHKPLTAAELNQLVASATVYTADQVDRPVLPDSAVPVEAYYPDSLRRSHLSGSAVVEFVVDASGRVEPETISIVTASHPAFGMAAREAVWSAHFYPALRAGQPVRQVVQLPMEFKAIKK